MAEAAAAEPLVTASGMSTGLLKAPATNIPGRTVATGFSPSTWGKPRRIHGYSQALCCLDAAFRWSNPDRQHDQIEGLLPRGAVLFQGSHQQIMGLRIFLNTRNNSTPEVDSPHCTRSLDKSFEPLAKSP